MNDMPLSHQQLQELGDGQVWARRLAERLLDDVHLAEDAMQDAWLAALQSRSEVRAPKQWLAGAVRHLALGEIRGRARRRRREEEASLREALPSTADTAGRLEAQELLISAILGLDEPFRSAVLARYVDELPPRKIAAKDGVSVSTVNSRLARGLDRLRTTLDDSHGGDSACWVSALVPLVAGPSPPRVAALMTTVVMKKFLLAAIALTLLTPAIRLLAQSPPSDVPSSLPVELVEYTGPEAPSPDAEGESASVLEPLETKAEPNRRVAAATGQAVGAKDLDILEGAPLRAVRVIDAASGQAVPGAEVFVISIKQQTDKYRPGTAASATTDFPADLRAFGERHGRAFATNAEGIARVPSPPMGARVMVRAGQRHGTGFLFGIKEETQIQIAPDRVIWVHVLGADGTAMAGVPVDLNRELREDQMVILEPVSRASTRPWKGEIAARIPLPFGEDYSEGESRWLVSVHGALAKPVTKEIFWDRWPTEPVTLQLAPSDERAVVVQVLAPSEDSAVCDLSPQIEDGSVVQVFRSTDFQEAVNPLLMARGGILEGGLYRAAPVGMEVEVIGAVWPKGGGLPFTGTGRGPSGMAAEGTLALDPWAISHRVVGRLVDSVGNGVPLHQLDVMLSQNVWIQGGLKTDASGHFEWRVALDAPPYASADLVLHEPVAPFRLTKVPANRLSAAVKSARELGTCVDLGDVLLPDPMARPATIRGRVVDSTGEGVVRTFVYWVDVDPSEDSPRFRKEAPPVTTDASGAFEIDDIERGAHTTLLVTPDGNAFHQLVPFSQIKRDEAGDLLVEIQSGIILTGEVLLDDVVPASRVSVMAWPMARGPMPDSTDVEGWELGVCAESGTFTIGGLRPGFYYVRAGVGVDHKDAVLVADVDVRGAPEANTNGGMKPLDLRGRLGVFDSRITNAEGYQLEATVSMTALKMNGGKEVYGFPDWLGTAARGEAIVYGKRRGMRLIIQKANYFPIALDPESAPEVIILERGLKIDIGFVSEAAIADAPGALRVELVPSERELDLPRQIQSSLDHRGLAKGALDEHNRVQLSVPKPGEYVVRLSIDYATRPGYHIRRRLTPEVPIALTVTAAADATTRYEVEVPSHAYEEALAFVRKRFDDEVRRGIIPSTLPFGEIHSQ